MILKNKVSKESQENLASIVTRIYPITLYWAAKTVIDRMLHISNSGRERVNESFFGNYNPI